MFDPSDDLLPGALQLTRDGAMSSLGVVATLIVAVHVASWGLTRSTWTDVVVARRLEQLAELGFLLAVFCGVIGVNYTISPSPFSWYVVALALIVSWFGLDLARPTWSERRFLDYDRTSRTIQAIASAERYWARLGAEPTTVRQLWYQALVLGGGAGTLADLAMMVQLGGPPTRWLDWGLGIAAAAMAGAIVFLVDAALVIQIFVALPRRRYANILPHAYLVGVVTLLAVPVGFAGFSEPGAAGGWLVGIWVVPALVIATQVVGAPGSTLWRSSGQLRRSAVAGGVLRGLKRHRAMLQAPPRDQPARWLGARNWVAGVTGAGPELMRDAPASKEGLAANQ